MKPDFEVIKSELALYRGSCPNCGGLVSDYRLKHGLPCFKCLPKDYEEASIGEVIKELKERKRLRGMRINQVVNEFLSEFNELFKSLVGSEPWSIQVLWAKRLALDTSFAMIAPTGVGKSTFGMVAAIYYALRGKKTYIIVPTTTLAMQYEKRLEEFADKLGMIIPICVIHSKLRVKERKQREEMIAKGSYDILVTTSKWLMNNFNKLRGHRFKLIFVDDVDAVMRGSKAINYILNLAGFADYDIEKAFKVMKLKKELASLSSRIKEEEEITKKLEYLKKEYSKLSEELLKKRERVRTVVIISSATGRPRGSRVKLFRELLGFEIGARTDVIRNVIDSYIPIRSEEELLKTLIDLIKKLGKGGLVYVPLDKGIEYAEYLAKVLTENGINAKAMHSKNITVLNEFINGSLDVLVGVATYYGVLVRGIDLPEVIRYAIFTGVPRHKVSLTLSELKPMDMVLLLTVIRDLISKEEAAELDLKLARVRRLIRRVGAGVLKQVEEVLSGGKKPTTILEKAFLELQEILKKYLGREDIIEKLDKHSKVVLLRADDKLYLLIPDAMTYIQASGRTSRLYVGGITKGLSVVLVDDNRLINGLVDKLKWVIDDFELINFNELDLDEVLKEIDEDRKRVQLVRAGLIEEAKAPIEVKTSLLIVESPNKARTIARFFGRPSSREIFGIKVYEVSLGNHTLLITSSGGHLFELIEDVEECGKFRTKYGIFDFEGKCLTKFIPVYGPIKKCLTCGHQFTEDIDKCPICGSSLIKDNRETINALRRMALEVDEVLIGTDPDAEGEKIAYDIAVILGPYASKIRRIEFHEVTRKAILKALNTPRDINYDLVKAQIVRRVEDRWIGFTLSPKLWTDMWPRFCEGLRHVPKEKLEKREWHLRRLINLCKEFKKEYRNLSAGRVQTPVLGWVISNFEEHIKGLSNYLVINIDGQLIEVNLGKDVGADDIESIEVWVRPREVKEVTMNPLPPYTTDTALSDIVGRLKISPVDAMAILQDLFELGFITYHRTDSTRVSDVGIGVAKEYLISKYGDLGKELFHPRGWGTGGAHECIRPTRPADVETILRLINEGIIEPVKRLTKRHFIVYSMIFKRFIASQMRPAKLLKQFADIRVTVRLKNKEVLKYDVAIERYVDILDKGFLEINPIVKVLNKLKESISTYVPERDKDKVKIITKSSVPLYTEADLVKLMKERGIGRPSTYAKIIDVLFRRYYVIRPRGRVHIVPTLLGEGVYKYLVERYESLVSEERTKLLEEIMDSIEEGKLDYLAILNVLNEELRKYDLL